MAPFKHPQAAKLRNLAKTYRHVGFSNERFSQRLEMFLAVYAKHGVFTRETLGPELTSWMVMTRRAYYHSEVSVPNGIMLEDLGLLAVSPVYRPKLERSFLTMAERLERDAAIERRLVMVQNVKADLMALRTADFIANPKDEVWTGVWWWLLWDWRKHVTTGKPAMKPALRKFVAITQRMRELRMLHGLQLELVDLLEKPYTPMVLGLRKAANSQTLMRETA